MLVQVTGYDSGFLCQAAGMCIWRCRCAVLTSWQRKCLSLWGWNCSSLDRLYFAAFLWFLLCDRQECGKTGKSSAPKMHRRGKKSKRFLQNFRKLIQVLKAARSHSGNTFQVASSCLQVASGNTFQVVSSTRLQTHSCHSWDLAVTFFHLHGKQQCPAISPAYWELII